MHKRFVATSIMALVAFAAFSAVAGAAVTFDGATGTGFVGKGDVQLIAGWNNKQLQDNASLVQFQASSTTEVSWECTHTKDPDKIKERERTTTTAGIVSHVARERNQITGFNLSGYSSTGTVTSTDGPALNSCSGSSWYLSSPAGDPVAVDGASLQVSTDGGTTWSPLPITPTTI